MENKILVAYASKYGSTKEIAEKIGEVLKQVGVAAVVADLKSARDITPYQNIVIGSAMYMGQWRKEAVNFLKNNEAALSQRKVWVFGTGPSGKGDPAQLLKGVTMPAKVKEIVDRIKPQDSTVFHGNLDAARMSGFEKWIVKRVGGGAGDFRDWQMITDWANKIAGAIKKAG
ncbi:MAG TPA: flavodoxin domain-containing protein [Dehalococcoidales bacterium]|nr:flavodoxin domain-containing protein [Dehalococcoidales bacterium]